MSSSELEYWWKKINKEIERKSKSQRKRLNNIYNDFNNNYNYYI
jgi:G:T-mismatch repair DNA endonuclease (very short patch repair protein)